MHRHGKPKGRESSRKIQSQSDNGHNTVYERNSINSRKWRRLWVAKQLAETAFAHWLQHLKYLSGSANGMCRRVSVGSMWAATDVPGLLAKVDLMAIQ